MHKSSLHLRIPIKEPMVYNRGEQTFSVKSLIANILGFTGQVVSVTITQLAVTAWKGPWTIQKWMGTVVICQTWLTKRSVGPDMTLKPYFAHPGLEYHALLLTQFICPTEWLSKHFLIDHLVFSSQQPCDIDGAHVRFLFRRWQEAQGRV